MSEEKLYVSPEKLAYVYGIIQEQLSEAATTEEIDEALGLTDIETNYTTLSAAVDDIIEQQESYIGGETE